jgi:hypothetical protein
MGRVSGVRINRRDNISLAEVRSRTIDLSS